VALSAHPVLPLDGRAPDASSGQFGMNGCAHRQGGHGWVNCSVCGMDGPRGAIYVDTSTLSLFDGERQAG
jgi:hypothetical protein